jgi:hypothetical protein
MVVDHERARSDRLEWRRAFSYGFGGNQSFPGKTMTERSEVGMMRVDESQMRPPDQPIAPLFLCGADRDWIELKEIVATERILLRSATVKKYEFLAYAADETKWNMRYESPGLSIWTRLSQFTQTPKITVPLQWNRCGTYRIDELRAAFLQAVEHDDDVLTQFVERDDLITRLNAGATFGEFVRIWHSRHGQVNAILGS